MFEVRYPLSALAGDYLRALLGLGIGSVIAATYSPDNRQGWVSICIGLGVIVIFLIYTLQTFGKHLTRIKLTEEGIGRSPWPLQQIAWNQLDGIALRYYSVRRKRKDGWMTMTLKSGKTSIELESNLPHFQAIVTRAAKAAKDNKVTVDRITLDNLNAIGVNLTE
jgi:hypothetical protein